MIITCNKAFNISKALTVLPLLHRTTEAITAIIIAKSRITGIETTNIGYCPICNGILFTDTNSL